MPSVLSKFDRIGTKMRGDDPSLNNSTILYLSCEPINKRFGEYIIQTTHGEVMELIEKFKKEKSYTVIKGFKSGGNRYVGIGGVCGDKCLKSVKSELEKHNDRSLNSHYKRSSSAWRDWCNDVLIYHCYCCVYNNEMIPVIELKGSSMRVH